MKKYGLLAIVLFLAVPVLADSECRKCTNSSNDYDAILACRLAGLDELGSYDCRISSFYLRNAIVARCVEYEPYCMQIEVYG